MAVPMEPHGQSFWSMRQKRCVTNCFTMVGLLLAPASLLSFGVTKIDKGAFSWHIGNYQSESPSAIRGDTETIARAMGDLKCTLYKDKEVLDTANCCLLGGKDGKTVNPNIARERLVEALNSLTFTAVESRDPPTPNSMVLQLWGRPLTNIARLHHDWVELIKKKSFVTRYHVITPRKPDLNCVNCKSLTHPQHGCPLPKTVGWFGPTPKPSVEEEDYRSTGNAGSRGGRGRGQRGYNRAGPASFGRGYGRGDPNGSRGRARYPRY
ncbi:hypothetical protein K435DRAFT_871973 [Dendrothele bispora CBS 962.96]|uniref:Uncharacterized protein n=1 Tax=Dendrothele bispora (strain CBS 962.96) TaxID=1314807 RepID=A0A4S8L2V2_DENBC|nr:hypothetical protein K435DRAFT_871973 [Dendrothele bispora CBS 962.96]